MNFFVVLNALTWKNIKLRFRNWPSLIIEIAIPLVSSFFVCVYRASMEIIPTPGYATNATSVWERASFNTRWFLYVPKVPVTEALVEARDKMRWQNVKGFNTLEEGVGFYFVNGTCHSAVSQQRESMVSLISEESNKENWRCSKNLLPVVIFEGVDNMTKTLPKKLTYMISLSLLSSDKINAKNPFENKESPFYVSETLWLQHAIGEMFIVYWDPNIQVKLDLERNTFPVPWTRVDPFQRVRHNWPLLVIEWSFMMTVLTTIKGIVLEKQLRLKEYMKLMGMSLGTYWFSWLLMGFLMGQMPIMIVLFFLKRSTANGSVLMATGVEILWLILEIFLIESVSFACLVSCFMKKTGNALIASFCIYMIFLEGGYHLTAAYPSKLVAFLTGIPIYVVGFTKTMLKIDEAEKIGFKLRLNTITDGLTSPIQLSILEGITLMVLNTMFNIIIVWYIDNVRPGQYGEPKPYLFFLSIYNGKPAVAQVSLNIYHDQITVLLGKNGAGKTTMMSLITGFTPPTSGVIFVDGFDIQKNVSEARNNLGLCPQHDILFNNLSCKEHLKFYCMIKGMKEVGIFDLLTAVGLFEKRNVYATKLSAGQRRKLSVACAMVADNKIIVLDEPTTGMDSRARRELWAFLKKAKTGRTILLTTQNMEEADALGDRIVILVDGVMRCCGTPKFLKRIYGFGYQLTLVIAQDCDVKSLTKAIKSMMKAVVFQGSVQQEAYYHLPHFMSREIPTLLRMLETNGRTLGVLSYDLTPTKMEEIFLKAEDSQVLDSIGLSETVSETDSARVHFSRDSSRTALSAPLPTSPEAPSSTNSIKTVSSNVQVSGKPGDKINVGQPEVQTDMQRTSPIPEPSPSPSTPLNPHLKTLSIEGKSNKRYTRNTGCCLFCQHLIATFVKRFILLRHGWFSAILQLAIPGILLCLGVLFRKISDKHLEDKNTPVIFSAKYLKGKDITVGSDTLSNTSLTAFYRSQILDAKMDVFEAPDKMDFETFLDKRASLYDNLEAFRKQYVIGAHILHVPDKSVAYYQGQQSYSSSFSMQFLVNAHVKHCLGKEYMLQSGIKPILRPEEVTKAKANDKFDTITWLILGFMILPTFFIYPLIEEREVGSKHLQAVCCINRLAYWWVTFLWDIFLYSLAVSGCMAFFYVMESYIFIEHCRWKLTLIIFGVYGMAMLPHIYFLSAQFQRPAAGITFVLMLNFFGGVMLPTLVNGGYKISLDHSSFLISILPRLDYLAFILIPNHNLFILLNQLLDLVVREGDSENLLDYFQITEKGNILPIFIKLTGQIVGFWVMVFVSDFKVARRLWYCLGSVEEEEQTDLEKLGLIPQTEDLDVTEERLRIIQTPVEELFETDSLILKNISKTYSETIAVRDICLGIPQQECFGLLGQNGAGKSTTFKMITGDVALTIGNIFLMGKSVRNQMRKVLSYMGYCPQYDPLIDGMTGRETLYFYGRLKGVPECRLNNVVTTLLDDLTLKQYGNMKTNTYSVGNKRKLSTAISLLGDLPFILLDEPTSGLDPDAKRIVWNVLKQAKASGKTVVFTSQSMEECEMLCTRIAIMVAGKIKCLGSPEHLKSKFAQGFTIIVKTSLEEEDGEAVEGVENYISASFSGARMIEKQQGYLHFQVPELGWKVSDIFEKMEKVKARYDLEDYTISYTTLEHVFLSFIKDSSTMDTSDGDICIKALSCFD